MSESDVLSISGISKSYGTRQQRILAVRDVSFRVGRGEIMGIVGESGSGKSTIGRCVMGLVRPDAGTIQIGDTMMTASSGRALRRARRHVQLIFQDPLSAMNGYMTVKRHVEEPLIVHHVHDRQERAHTVREMLTHVGLSEEFLDAYPSELSGGQAQRVMIARALVLQPKLIVCDEVLSALDASVQAQVMQLLISLRAQMQLSYLFISHNLMAVNQLCDRVAVLYVGEIVEIGSMAAIRRQPAHPYTRALFASALQVPESVTARIPLRPLQGEATSLSASDVGCSFRARCPLATDRCAREKPVLRAASNTQAVACHYA